MDRQKKKDIETILGNYFQQEWDPNLIRDIQSWLLSEESQAEKEAVLRGIWERYRRENPGYGTRAQKAWERTCRRLGFPHLVQEETIPEKRLNPHLWIKVAVVIFPLLLLIGSLWLVTGNKDSTGSQQVTSIRVQHHGEELMLPCGTLLRAREGTRVTYGSDFLRERIVHLEGEAYFTVVYREGSPFTVETPHLQVRVLGTEFNLRDYPEETTAEVSLTRGSVEVTVEDSKTVLTPNERLVLDLGSHQIELTDFEWQQLDNRWNDRVLLLDDVPLAQALEEIAAYYGKEIIYKGELSQTGGVRLPVYPDDRLADVLQVLQALNRSFTFEIANQTLVITAEPHE